MERKTIWEQFVDQKSEWIGGTLVDTDSDPMIGAICGEDAYNPSTEIVDVIFDKETITFTIVGKDFNCGFNIKYGGISGINDKNWIHMGTAYGGFKIKKSLKEN